MISTLAEVEIRSAFAISVRSTILSRVEGLLLMQQFREDITSDRFDVSPVLDADFKNAGRLMEHHAFSHRLRTLDALQLAVALKLRNAGKLDYFVTGDKVLCEVAALEGIAVINPDVP
jgi:predicted nucleic acid-binding protein